MFDRIIAPNVFGIKEKIIGKYYKNLKILDKFYCDNFDK